LVFFPDSRAKRGDRCRKIETGSDFALIGARVAVISGLAQHTVSGTPDD